MAEKDYGKFKVIDFNDEKLQRHKKFRQKKRQLSRFNRLNQGEVKLQLAKGLSQCQAR